MPDQQRAPKVGHTKGPWSHYDDTDQPTKRHEIVAWGRTVARIYRADEEAKANAALIAAAPELLEALKRLVAERDDDPERYPLEPTCNECTGGLTPLAHDRGLCHWHEARAAIAKAEGR